MIEAQRAAFSFESFKVPKFSYDEGNDSGSDIKLGFNPSGIYNSATGEFELTLQFMTHDASNLDKVIFQLTSIAIFKFDSNPKLEEIPPFFYKNAIAIMFPYLRAFISTLTLQANTKLLRLGLMNLSDLEKPLKENTSEF
jgi:preprotein translocase subunit SecB